ncbi:MAG: glycosyltransferase [Anaerolineales bacterium]|nr:glycosyltransferase [Anaerolineales bacterium]
MEENHSPIPRVSIGLAVYNGERYLREAIDSILAQTFTDFELVISDNASTDKTEEICRDYAAKDSRIRYSRNPENIGGANNENLVFKLSRGEYFRLAAHDDVLAPRLLEKCVEVLERDPSVVLCVSMIDDIDENGKYLKTTSPDRGISDKLVERFSKLSRRGHSCEETYGLMRSDIYRKTRLQLNYTDSDRTLLCELALYGRFHMIPEVLFYKRYHPGNYYLDWRSRMVWFTPSNMGKIVFPNWMQFKDYLDTVGRVPLNTKDKLLCYGVIWGPWLFRSAKWLLKDLLVAGYMALHSQKWRQQRYQKTMNWE